MMSRSPLVDDEDFSVFFAKGRYDKSPNGKLYPARARPYTIQQWFKSSSKPTESKIVLVDPDFVHLRPISEHPSVSKVSKGHMVSSDGWQPYSVDRPSMPWEYQTGPVWILHATDLERMLPLWQKKTDSLSGDALMREQYGFQLAAKQLKIPAKFEKTLAHVLRHTAEVPYAMHYFRSYNYQGFKFHKALASSGWYADKFNNRVPTPFTCGAPLLQEPPAYKKFGTEDDKIRFSLWTMWPPMNRAFIAYRSVYCEGEREQFAEKGKAAFGFMRLVHPRCCKVGGKQYCGITRYRVDASKPVTWKEENGKGGGICTAEALSPT
eukprot:TRINITY_DN26015_c0_g1_i1.p2 TRINITY_DN26015_c0_g1~~TRINITY_DN26015_c0_g1_i1.p2  ORF type:complete len:322 (-),score=28.83 TRINITY_DN26015_c0_g1_i1:583-1548(-)